MSAVRDERVRVVGYGERTERRARDAVRRPTSTTTRWLPVSARPKVLLSHSYYLRLDPKQWSKMRPYPPLATLYVAADLRRAGYPVAVFDSMLADDEEDFRLALKAEQPDVVVLYEDNFNFLSKMCLGRMREAALAMAVMSREAGATVLAAGSDVTDQPEVYLAAGVDVAIRGEGDHTVREAIDSLAAGRPVVELAGLAGTVIAAQPVNGSTTAVNKTSHVALHAPARRNERHPDVFAHPARDLVDIDRYARLWREHHGSFTLNMVSTRGCPFHCNWCAKPIWGQRYAMRSAADVAAEMAAVKRDHAPDRIWFADDIFGLRPTWVTDFAAEVAGRDARIPFTIQSRCDLIDDESAAGLAAAGCTEVWMGAESGSQSVLDAMDKGISVDQIRAARIRLGNVGVRACFFVQFGYPGETWDDIQATIALVRDTLPDDIGVSVSYPLPGTRFHAMVADQLGEKTNWDVSNDLEMMFAGTYTSAFYRHLHRALHDDLDLRRRELGLSRAPSPVLAEVELDDHRLRVAEAWTELDHLEATCRVAQPTTLPFGLPRPPVPDLTETWG